jgi:DNA-binding NarL/FixJ family response regulator
MPAHAPPTSVLIADDHPIFRRGLCDILAGDARLRLVGEAVDGDQAWEMIQQLHPTVAVLDVHMPARSGLEVGRLALGKDPPTEAILLTMDGEESLVNDALSCGIKGYVLKDSAVTELLEAIRQVSRGQCFISPALSSVLVRRRAKREALRERKAGLGRLTPTEQRVLRLIAEDRTSKEIAEILRSSIRTVETHRQNISHKLELSGSHSLLRFAFDHKAEI